MSGAEKAGEQLAMKELLLKMERRQRRQNVLLAIRTGVLTAGLLGAAAVVVKIDRWDVVLGALKTLAGAG